MNTLTEFELLRSKMLMQRACESLSLDLSGLTVLTEAATGGFGLTPIIAALAGAKKVYALAKESAYGSAEEVIDYLHYLSRYFHVPDGVIEPLGTRNIPMTNEIDIITNLGSLRPLNQKFLEQFKKPFALPLMWETWEFREEDLDITYCRDRGIPVLGTNESHPALNTLSYVGVVALKALLENSIEVLGSKVLLVGGGVFAERIKSLLSVNGAAVYHVASVVNSEALEELLGEVKDADAIVVAEHHSDHLLVGGADAPINICSVSEQNQSLLFLHICGNVDSAWIKKSDINHFPNQFAPSGYMSLNTAYAGVKPLIDLHAGGLRVGSLMCQAMANGFQGKQAELQALATDPIAQGFQGYHY